VSLEERIRRGYQGFTERGLDAMGDFWHPEIEYEEAADFPGAGSYSGREAVRARFAEYMDTLGDVDAEVGRVAEPGDRAAWEGRFRGTTREGLPHDHTWGYLGRFEDGPVRECRAFYNADHAFEALECAG
jgi:ketosteroid isomerase-like protein